VADRDPASRSLAIVSASDDLHATTLLSARVPVHVVAARIGHADAAITLRVHAQCSARTPPTWADVFATAVSSC